MSKVEESSIEFTVWKAILQEDSNVMITLDSSCIEKPQELVK